MVYSVLILIAGALIVTIASIYWAFKFDRRLRQRMAASPSGGSHGVISERFIETTSFILLVGLSVVFCLLWLQGNRTLIFQDITESFGVFLTVDNAKDIVTLVLQDVSTSPNPAGHPYLYIHHPNFVPRVLTMVGFRLGAGVEELMLVMSLISVLALGFGFLALRASVSAEAALAAVVVVVLSFRLFYQHAGDLVRAPHYVLFWAFLYLYSLKGLITEKSHRIGVGITVALTAATDWGFFAFFLFFSIAWIILQNRRHIPARELLLTVFIPTSLVFAIYFSVIISALGLNFFVTDVLTTYLGRSGQQLSQYFIDTDATDKIVDYYRANNVVIWLGGVWGMGVVDFIRDIFSSNSHWFRWIEKRTFVIFFILFVLCRNLSWAQVAILTTALFVSLKVHVPPIVSLFTVAIAIWVARQPITNDISYDNGKSKFSFGNLATVRRIRGWAKKVFSKQHHEAINFMVVIAFANLAAFAAFPAYYAFLQRSARPPLLLLEMGVLMLVIVVMLSAVGAIRRAPSMTRKAAPFVVASCALMFISWFGISSVRNYIQHPPAGLAYAKELSKPEYRGRIFISNIDPAAVWYYTRGAVVYGGDGWNAVHLTGHGSVGQLFFADGKTNQNYQLPEYSLCFAGLGFSIDSVATQEINGMQCNTPGTCTCRDIANMLRDKGHTPTRVEDEYSVTRINYK